MSILATGPPPMLNKSNRLYQFIYTFLAVVFINPTASAADLADYVQQKDESYKYEVLDTARIGACDAHVLKLTSQTWRGIDWWHYVSILIPDNAKKTDKAVLFIGGGSQQSNPPGAESNNAKMLAGLAYQAGCPLAILNQVPNQPLINNLYEDNLIAFTYHKYLLGGNDNWPLLQPMVKSAVRAMDCTQQYLREKHEQEINGFIVSGASKRGWTTFLTAAVDKRVKAIAPMVIYVLNMQEQMSHQLKSYGAFSNQIKPYLKYNIPQRMETPRGQELLKLVDPYAYRKMLTMPKLVVLGTNDAYWTVDSSSLYFPDLPNPKHLYYVPNRGHGLGTSIVPTVAAFFKTSINGNQFDRFVWERDEATLRAKWDGDAIVRLWQATSENRDFRGSKFSSRVLEGKDNVEFDMDEPESGFRVYAIEVIRKTKEGLPYSSFSEMHVIPDKYPFPDKK